MKKKLKLGVLEKAELELGASSPKEDSDLSESLASYNR